MKNSANVVPGVFAATGHDYRADLLPFFRAVLGITVTDDQMQRLAAWLEQREVVRSQWVKNHGTADKSLAASLVVAWMRESPERANKMIIERMRELALEDYVAAGGAAGDAPIVARRRASRPDREPVTNCACNRLADCEMMERCPPTRFALYPKGLNGPVPTLVFVPDDPPAAVPLVLLGHGAHLGKDDPTMQLLYYSSRRRRLRWRSWMRPGHGERRPQDLTDEAWEADVVARTWEIRPCTAQVLAEWPLVIAEARRAVPCRERAGRLTRASRWARSSGSRSSADCAATSRGAVRRSAGTSARSVRSRMRVNEMIDERDRQARRTAVLMVNMTDDESFPIAPAIEVLEAIPGPCSMHVYVGGHRDLPPASMPGMIRFLRHALAD